MAMSETSIAANLNQALNVKVNLFPKLTLNPVLPVNELPETINLILGKVTHLSSWTDTGLVQNPPAQSWANAVEILE
jgi:hypothetical protein